MRSIVQYGVLTAGLVAWSAASAMTFTISGTIIFVDIDDGTGKYAGTVVNDPFTGAAYYPDAAGPPDNVEPDEANYSVDGPPFTVHISNGVTTVSATELDLNIQNNHPLTVEEAAFYNALTGGSVPPGTEADVWNATGIEPGAFYDQNNDLINGMVFEVVLGTFDTTTFGDLSYQPVPPDLSSVDLGIFVIEEADAAGQTVFFAVGEISAMAVGAAADFDGDGTTDGSDNCLLVANDQSDTDGDGIGNLCDADLTGDCQVNFADLSVFKTVFFSGDDDADFNGDGSVNFADLAILKTAFFLPPGPAADPNDCS